MDLIAAAVVIGAVLYFACTGLEELLTKDERPDR